MPTAPDLPRAPTDEDADIQALHQHLDRISRTSGDARLVGPDGEAVEVPRSALRALELVTREMVRGRAVAVVPHDEALTTQQAADLLRVSRPHVVKLLDGGAIDHHMVGTHRRVRAEDVLAYRERRATARREKLDELTRLSEELEGGYR